MKRLGVTMEAAGREWRLLGENGGYWAFEEKEREWEGWVPLFEEKEREWRGGCRRTLLLLIKEPEIVKWVGKIRFSFIFLILFY